MNSIKSIIPSAVQVAMDFAARDSHTLVVACPDHNCGGMTIGSETSPVAYDETQLDDLLGPLRRMKLTSTGIMRELGADSSPANLRGQVEKWWGVAMADSELARVRELSSGGMDLNHALSEVFSRFHTGIGWTAHGHTGEDVPLWAFGPGRPTGLLDNTQLARVAADAAGLNLAAASATLFSDLGDPSSDPGLGIDRTGDAGPVLVIGSRRLPLGTDLLITGTDTTALDGVSVLSPNGHVYGPSAALAEFHLARRDAAGKKD